jgi:putative acetyltransferase
MDGVVRVVVSDNVSIRSETRADFQAIHHLTNRAFDGKPYSDGTEPELIDRMRASDALVFSLVAELDKSIVGHVALSPAFAEDGSEGWYALGPISVEPALQRKGVGAMLIRDAMIRLTQVKARGCIVLGDVNYYTRHGFVPRPDLAHLGEPAEHFMVRLLADEDAETVVSFHPILQTTGTP